MIPRIEILKKKENVAFLRVFETYFASWIIGLCLYRNNCVLTNVIFADCNAFNCRENLGCFRKFVLRSFTVGRFPILCKVYLKFELVSTNFSVICFRNHF